MSNDLKAILFDHDGTLINSEAVHFALWQQVLRPFQVELTEQYYNDVMAGIPVPQNAIDAVRDFKLPISAEELAESKQLLTKEHLMKGPFPLMPGADDTLKRCKDKGLRIAIVTGGSRLSVMRTMECYGYEDIIECVVAVEDVERSKPAPDCYLKALNEMGLSASEAMAVEDTEHGLKAAVAAGLRCVAIPTAQSETHDFSAASAQYSNLSDWVRAEIDCL